MLEKIKFKISGHVKIFNPLTNEILLDRYNKIHYGNMSQAIAYQLGDRSGDDAFHIDKLRLGSGGENVTATIRTRKEERVYGDEGLYAPFLTIPPASAVIKHLPGETFSVLVLSFNATGFSSEDVGFNEIGLQTKGEEGEKVLSHITFENIPKPTAGNDLRIVYTIKIQLGEI